MTTDTIPDRIERARRGVGPGGQGPRPGKRGSPLARAGTTLLLFALPSLVLLVLLNFFPVVYSFLQSLQQGTPSTLPWETPFVGFQNYIDVVGASEFRAAAIFTVIFTVVGVFGSWIVGLLLALLLRTRIPGGGVFKVLLLLPWIVPVVVSATSWNFLVATPQSPGPIILQALGFGDVNFLGDPVLAQIVVCIFKVWISFPFMMMMMAAALESVDNNVYEASRVDGASKWKTLTNITLPMISRSTYISWILMTIFCVNDFTTIFLLTGGGPVNATQSLVVLAYNTVFLNFDTGPGVAVAFLMTLVLIIISVVLFRQIRKVQIL